MAGLGGETVPAKEFDWMADKMLAAMEECEALLPVDENAPSDEERFETDLRMAECLRENGIDVEDPEPGMGLALPIDPGDDEHMVAVTQCSDEAGLGLELGDDTEGDS
jgi:hypothetical protein